MEEINKIKFRQPIYVNGKFDHFHFWGFIDNEYIPPDLSRWEAHETSPADIRQYPERSQQYTGREDKYGNEIYNGDIIEGTSVWEERYKWKVIFVNGSFKLTRTTLGMGNKIVREFEKDVSDYEVVGNTYANQEATQ